MNAQDYTRFTGMMPSASEIFGTYRPMIGWNSKRKRDRSRVSEAKLLPWLIELASKYIAPVAQVEWKAETGANVYELAAGRNREPSLREPASSMILGSIAGQLREAGYGERPPAMSEDWRGAIPSGLIDDLLKRVIKPEWERRASVQLEENLRRSQDETEIIRLRHYLLSELQEESLTGKMVETLLEHGLSRLLDRLFYGVKNVEQPSLAQHLSHMQDLVDDPFTQFDPKLGLPGVSVSPIGIVHLFREYFFEFDTFLGQPVGHVWLSPGSSVELVETSTRRTLMEQTIESERESTTRSDRNKQEQDELGEAIKRENRADSKLGFSTKGRQSWVTGSIEATTSLNLDSTQKEAREETIKRMREQTEKLSTEIRDLYKTTFKTITETTDVSSKRYVLENRGDDLLNYELRRKMRQVGIQVQDIGTYLCWETFVDEPGRDLGLGQLVHIGKPAQVLPQPNSGEIPKPGDLNLPFEIPATWDFPHEMKVGFSVPVVSNGPVVPAHITVFEGSLPITVEPGYRIELERGHWIEVGIKKIVSGDQSQRYRFICIRMGEDVFRIAVVPAGRSLNYDERVEFLLSGELKLVPTPEKLEEIRLANSKINSDLIAASRAQQRADDHALYESVKERIEQASKLRPRRFEDLREEERTVIYRTLILDLIDKEPAPPILGPDIYDADSYRRLHVYSTVLNAIFDIEKMLYFVAPEWWRPRKHYSQSVAAHFPRSYQMNWNDDEGRTDNYYLTANSDPARLGSSLGWLLQLDGDDNRNRFLNAPWVRAVIPIRPGKEAAAVAWLSKVGVEGVDGLEDHYTEEADIDEIREGLSAAGESFSTPITIRDAINYLCLRVTAKHTESNKVQLYPNDPDIPDADKIWATPMDRVYEHGFHPLEKSFRFDPRTPGGDTGSGNFEVVAQWTEILPTDQVVPVAVRYNPLTGRQNQTEE